MRPNWITDKKNRRCPRSITKGERQSDSVLWLRYLESRFLIRVGLDKNLNSKIRNWFLHFNTKVINLRNLSQILSVRYCCSSYILIRPQKSPNIIWCYMISSKWVAFLQNMNFIFIELEIELLQSRLHSYIVIGWKISRSL